MTKEKLIDLKMNLFIKILLMEWKKNSNKIKPNTIKERRSSKRCMAAKTLEDPHLTNKECLSHI